MTDADIFVTVIRAFITLVNVVTDGVIDEAVSDITFTTVTTFMVDTSGAAKAGDVVRTESVVGAFVDVDAVNSVAFIVIVTSADIAPIYVCAGAIVMAIVATDCTFVDVSATNYTTVAFISGVAWTDVHVAVFVD